MRIHNSASIYIGRCFKQEEGAILTIVNSNRCQNWRPLTLALHIPAGRPRPPAQPDRTLANKKAAGVCARWDLLIRGCSIKHVIIFLLRRSICKQLWSQSWWTICYLVITEFLIKMKTSKLMFIISSEMTCPSHSPDSEPHLSPYRGVVTCV